MSLNRLKICDWKKEKKKSRFRAFATRAKNGVLKFFKRVIRPGNFSGSWLSAYKTKHLQTEIVLSQNLDLYNFARKIVTITYFI